MKNIVLIGMPFGKEHGGRCPGKMLGLHFLDSDLVIQETEGKLLSEIIEEKGPDGFLAVEIGSTPICSVRRRSLPPAAARYLAPMPWRI